MRLSRIRSSVCRLNDEKVVKPPHIPTMTKARKLNEATARPPGPVKVAKNPITNDPMMLISIVPQGNCGPRSSATNAASPNRATPPSAEPSATNRQATIITEHPRLV
jgi:hypothetical protein